MTPEERSVLQNIGIVLWSNLNIDIPIYFLYGFFAPLAILNIHNLVIYRSLSSNSTKGTLSVIIFSFLGATGVLLSTFPIDVGAVAVFMHDVANKPLADVVKSMDHILNGPWTTYQRWLISFPPVMNDALIIWRAWSIFSGRRWAKYILASTWIITADLGATSQVLSFVVNLFATSLIAYVLW
ncbi:hypothetical protein H0H92_010842 [Tricholoma furcatifolium]|nr:hypothetical protein H0H92_010842 [Tricholoma furcatifolium]